MLDKFLQEVCWRTYWKGWLELRPSVWTSLSSDGRRPDARSGPTTLHCFAAGRRPSRAERASPVSTPGRKNWRPPATFITMPACGSPASGFSRWSLPWSLGADFFLRHLLDGDPASNTLSWRWVAGLQTRGKTYLARASNIDEFTGGRFPSPEGLAEEAIPLQEPPPSRPRRLLARQRPDPSVRTGIAHHGGRPES